MQEIDWGKIWESAVAVLLASLGGLARLLNLKDENKLGWSRILSEIFIAGFSGLMALKAALALELSGDWLGLISGLAGWIGPLVLDALIKPVGKILGIDTEKIQRKEKEKNDEQE